MAVDVCEFISSLFEKSKALNDMNTQFLHDLEFGELTLKQRIDLFYRNTEYHENLLKTIGDIVKDLDKTDVMLDKKQKTLLQTYKGLDEFTQDKVYRVIDTLKNTQFVPKFLSTCPKCGGKLTKVRSGGCSRIPLIIGGQTLGYTYKCSEKEETTNEPE